MSYTKVNWRNGATALSAENFNHMDQGIADAHDDIADIIDNIIAEKILAMHPVGTIRMTTEDVNPSTYMGGVWIKWGSGRVPVGVDSNDTSFDTVEETGGSKDAIIPSHSHTFSGNQLPTHTHTFSGTAVGNHTHTGPSHTHTEPSHVHDISAHDHGVAAGYFVTKESTGNISVGSIRTGTTGTLSYPYVGSTSNTRLVTSSRTSDTSMTTRASRTGNTGAAGTGATGAAGGHTPAGTNSSVSAGTPSGSISTVGSSVTNANLQPYITCYMWKRTQ